MKRNLFNELKEGFTALESAREGKITLRQHVVEKKNWEQGRASLNAQAAILIRMVERNPDTVERLSAI